MWFFLIWVCSLCGCAKQKQKKLVCVFYFCYFKVYISRHFCECVRKDRQARALHFDSPGTPVRNKSAPPPPPTLMGAIVQAETAVIGQGWIRWYTSPLYSVAPHNPPFSKNQISDKVMAKALGL